MHSSTFGERITAAISTVVALALLGAALSAQQAPKADQLASLEADLRLQLKLAFGKNRSAYGDQVAILEGTMAAWQASAQTPEDYELLVGWLEASIDQTMPGERGDLPAPPQFSDVRPPEPAETKPPQVEEIVDAPADDIDEQPAQATTPVGEPDVATAAEASVDADESVVVDEAFVDGATPWPAEADVDDPASAATPAETPLAADPASHAEHSITVAPGEEVSSGAAADVASEPPTAAPEPSGPGDASPAPVTINLAELNARIAGYHQGLTEINAALVVGGAPSAEHLGRLVQQLERLAGQYQFVRLYFDALTPEEQRRAVAPRSMIETIELVAAQVAAASGGDLLQDFDAAHADRPSLADRLQHLAAAVREAEGAR